MNVGPKAPNTRRATQPKRTASGAFAPTGGGDPPLRSSYRPTDE